MTSQDPLANLGQTITDEAAAAERRFDDADRFTQPRTSAPSTRQTVIRRNFSFPPDDYALLAELEARCLQAGFAATKSELVRAGLHTLCALSPEALRAAHGRLEKVKTGRGARPSASPPAP